LTIFAKDAVLVRTVDADGQIIQLSHIIPSEAALRGSVADFLNVGNSWRQKARSWFMRDKSGHILRSGLVEKGDAVWMSSSNELVTSASRPGKRTLWTERDSAALGSRIRSALLFDGPDFLPMLTIQKPHGHSRSGRSATCVRHLLFLLGLAVVLGCAVVLAIPGLLSPDF
jgi:hypothetical protein